MAVESVPSALSSSLPVTRSKMGQSSLNLVRPDLTLIVFSDSSGQPVRSVRNIVKMGKMNASDNVNVERLRKSV